LAHGFGAFEEVFSCAFGVGGFFDLGEVEVPFDQGFELDGDGGGDEVWAGVFVEGGLGLAEFVDCVVAIEFDADIVAAIEGEPGFEGGGADLLVVDPDAGAGGGTGDADSSFDAAGEEEEGEEGQ